MEPKCPAPVALAVAAWLVAGCAATYEPKPASPEDSAHALESRTLSDPRLQKFIALAAASDGSPGPIPAWDLSRLTLAAIYYHPDLDLARAKLAAARAGVISAGQIPNPSLGVGLSYNSSVTTPSPWTIGPVITFLLESFGRREYRTAEARALTEAAREDLASAGWAVRGRVRTSLLNLWEAAERLRLIDQQLALQDRLVGLLERRFAVGEASSLEVGRQRINRDQISLARRNAQRQGADARVQLAIALGVPVRALEGVPLALESFDQPAEPDPRAAGELRREALLKRTDVQGSLAQYQAAQSALQLQVASQFPNLALGPGYAYDQGARKYTLHLSADLPIFNQNQGPIAEAEARRKEAGVRLLALQARIMGAIDAAAARYRASMRTLVTADALLEAAGNRERQISRSFRAGQVDRPTLVTAGLELAAIRLSRLDALMRQRQALGALEDALQQPLFDPGRWPRVPERDPRLAKAEPAS